VHGLQLSCFLINQNEQQFITNVRQFGFSSASFGSLFFLFYSGKKKTHTDKNLLLVNENTAE